MAVKNHPEPDRAESILPENYRVSIFYLSRGAGWGSMKLRYPDLAEPVEKAGKTMPNLNVSHSLTEPVW